MRLARIIGLLLLCGSFALAGNTGKVAGTIKDKKTGEPIVGANVTLVDTKLGGATDLEGRYFILQVPPGKYTLQVSSVGYQPVRVHDVRVQVDLTTEIKASLEPTPVELPAVEVMAERKLVQKDVTSTRRTATREDMLGTPRMETANDIFKLQGGTFLGTASPTLQLPDGTQLQVRDESLKDVHVRGGRGGELLYLVDGVPVTHPIYGGRDVLELNLVDVDQVELLTGAFNAEYGEAQSGVVNITTRSGGEKFSGGLEYKTDQADLFGSSFNTDYASLYLGGPEPVTRYLLPALGIEVPGQLNYFVSTNGTLTNGELDNRRSREMISVLGVRLFERQDNTGNVNGKLTWEPSGNLKFTTSYQGSWKRWSDFKWEWNNFPDNTAAYGRNTHNLTFQWNHFLSKATFYNIALGYLSVDYRGSLYGKTPADFWRFDSTGRIYSTIEAPTADPATQFNSGFGFESIWRDDLSHTYTFKADFTSQVHPEHLIKTGVEVRYNDIRYVDIQDGGTKLSRYGEYLYRNGPPVDPPDGPFKEFGLERWTFHVRPTMMNMYLQDKFELEMLIINAGLRFDGFLAGKTVMSQAWKDKWQAATGLTPDWKEFRYKVSPRFGISFPISEETVVFFSYGHFNQLPELQYYYREPYSGAFAGNPKLDYEQTILYEFGLTHQLGDFWVVDVKSYAKDISKQVGTTHLKAASGLPVDVYDSKGYARARGLEFQLTKVVSDFTSGTATYTVQWANGYSSSAFDDYIRSLSDFPYPIRERPLSWDVRNQVILEATLASQRDEPISLFGLTLPDDWNLTILSRFSTGQPYTPFTLDQAEQQVKENTETGPSSSSIDIKFSKYFRISGIRLALGIDIFNVFNQSNLGDIVNIPGFNNYTGKPYKYGDVIPPSNQMYDWKSLYRLMDPRLYVNRRVAKLGLRVDW